MSDPVTSVAEPMDQSTTNGTADAPVATDAAAATPAAAPATEIVVDAEAATAAAAAAAAKLVEALPTEEETLWAPVKANPADFDSWQLLISYAERSKEKDGLDVVRRIYDGFLAEFPLCYLYWKTLADHEADDIDRVKAVYERAMSPVGFPRSVDLWTYYCTIVAEKSEDLGEIRALFERALAAVGSDWDSHQLWDKYIEFETSQEEQSNVIALHKRAIAHPLGQAVKYWTALTSLVSSTDAATLLTEEETADLTAAREKKHEEAKAENAEAEALGEVTAEEQRQYLVTKYEAIYNETIKNVEARRPYEAFVAELPYFQTKPLKASLVAAWHTYLTFLEAQGDDAGVVEGYERCLTPCANYPELWIRYASFLRDRKRRRVGKECRSRWSPYH
eukprot:TRINITY_DN2945_c0_g1_i2.p1 TRINITY_DN2945_c0_g1~~TRINITY_DN2945_c0_g1_i2.p1  ORF type:complete len:392 (-),score=122.31 TRINITY_DN2945_c0_g1_i2:94-1269(-)